MDKPKYEYLDVVALMLKNYREDKPLLDGAVLFRGSRFADGGSHGGDEQIRAYLLPQVAAGYTHGWDKQGTYISTYPVDRDTTRFYPAARLADHLRGESVTSYSVRDVERAIRPHVENLASLAGVTIGGHRSFVSQTEALERFIKASFYEAGVPARSHGIPARPQESFYYSGGPKVDKLVDVLNSLDRVTPENSSKAKDNVTREQPNEVTSQLAKLAVQHPEAMKAFRALYAAANHDLKQNLTEKHGNKSLQDFAAAAKTEPPTENQSRLLRLAQGLAENLRSTNPAARSRALEITNHLGQLNPTTTTVADVSREVSRINQTSMKARGDATGSTAAPAAQPAAPKASTPAAAGLARVR